MRKIKKYLWKLIYPLDMKQIVYGSKKEAEMKWREFIEENWRAHISLDILEEPWIEKVKEPKLINLEE